LIRFSFNFELLTKTLVTISGAVGTGSNQRNKFPLTANFDPNFQFQCFHQKVF
jgi:hypothetical protein